MNAKTFIFLCGVSALVLAWSCFSAAASFDCHAARTKQEKLICNNWQLSQADSALAMVYSLELKYSSNQDGLKKQQQQWLQGERNSCIDAQCLLEAYRSRITIIQNRIQKAIQEALREANEHFTIQGEPVNPRMLNDLLPLLSDTLPGPVAVDVNGGGNRYYAEVSVPEKGMVRATCKEGQSELTCQYQYLGRLANGMHVIKMLSNTGGSGTFYDLLLVRFLADTEYTDEGIQRSRLIMMRTGAFTLGAGYDGVIQIHADRISIGPGGIGIRRNAKTEVIVFR